MRNIECLVDVFYRMFEEKQLETKDEESESSKQNYKALIDCLDKKQKVIFYEYENDEFHASFAREHKIVEFMIEVLCSEKFFS